MISANGGLPAHRYTPQVTPGWPRGSERASMQAQPEQAAKREHEGGDDGNAKKRSRFMRMACKLRNKGF